MDVTALGSAAIGVIVGVIGAYVALRRDSRETRTQALSEAGKTIELLKEQTELMRQQGRRARGSGAGSSRPGTSARRASRSASRASRATTVGSSSR